MQSPTIHRSNWRPEIQTPERTNSQVCGRPGRRNRTTRGHVRTHQQPPDPHQHPEPPHILEIVRPRPPQPPPDPAPAEPAPAEPAPVEPQPGPSGTNGGAIPRTRQLLPDSSGQHKCDQTDNQSVNEKEKHPPGQGQAAAAGESILYQTQTKTWTLTC